ncbi:peptidase S8/S53 domain-containing protein [Lactarius quietus]|nr:peptidase S8/S53 domain-containing protein [Lactarius quietus]
MRYWPVLFFPAAAPLASLATLLASRWGDTNVKHTWDVVPENWEILSPPLAGSTIDLRIALKPHNENSLVEALNEVSSPNHPSTYSRLVTSWIEHYGIPSSSVSMTHSGSWLKVTSVPVYQANELLGASYQLYRHAETNDTILRTMSYSLPVALQDHIGTVVPTTYFGLPRKLRKTPRIPGGAAAEPPEGVTSRDNDVYMTPSYISTLYNSSGYVPAATARTRSQFRPTMEFPEPTDLTSFMKQYLHDGANATYTVVLINGGEYNPNQIDSQADPKIPQTITSGYAGDEQLVCKLFAQLGARGVSVLFTSGIGGVGGYDNGSCMANDGSGKVRFLPTFPASCPWITTVGGTIGAYPEVGANTSGGGFSNYFERPSYQNSDVSAFLETLGSQYEGLYNAKGRAYPDVAAQYYNYMAIVNGTSVMASTGSAGSTVFACMISLLNDFLLSRNEPPLGFLNPWLYGHGQAGLTDITSGSNPGCNTSGFSAGLDGMLSVSGLGTPNFGNLQQILMGHTLN